MAILRSLCPVVQAVSLDDFYLDVTGLDRLHGPPVELARMIKRRVREEVGVPVTAGIGANRLVAKVASESAKPDGLRDVLVERGLTGSEAAAFMANWRDVVFGVMGSDSGFSEPLYRNGAAVAYFLPDADYDEQLALDVSPPPRELVRVGMVYERL